MNGENEINRNVENQAVGMSLGRVVSRNREQYLGRPYFLLSTSQKSPNSLRSDRWTFLRQRKNAAARIL
jgi:hypothetical protein